ncbi:unnamed protein product [Prorocentrum cordatum]|uniref:Uncharacterized protein n=1 Tax=Prorocentrum cordatum TaxID=2364126 RepID=A0ABN9XD75_9DINO|nr:unnamed protein product [Polarella glacialis]
MVHGAALCRCRSSSLALLRAPRALSIQGSNANKGEAAALQLPCCWTFICCFKEKEFLHSVRCQWPESSQMRAVGESGEGRGAGSDETTGRPMMASRTALST